MKLRVMTEHCYEPVNIYILQTLVRIINKTIHRPVQTEETSNSKKQQQIKNKTKKMKLLNFSKKQDVKLTEDKPKIGRFPQYNQQSKGKNSKKIHTNNSENKTATHFRYTHQINPTIQQQHIICQLVKQKKLNKPKTIVKQHQPYPQNRSIVTTRQSLTNH